MSKRLFKKGDIVRRIDNPEVTGWQNFDVFGIGDTAEVVKDQQRGSNTVRIAADGYGSLGFALWAETVELVAAVEDRPRTGFGRREIVTYDEEITIGDVWRFTYNDTVRVVHVQAIYANGHFGGFDLARNSEWRRFSPDNATNPKKVAFVDIEVRD